MSDEHRELRDKLDRIGKLLAEVVRERENYNGWHQHALMELDRAKLVLRMAKHKLQLYRSRTVSVDPASYVGGVEFTQLMAQIDEVLT
jgi:hypothetical protein